MKRPYPVLPLTVEPSKPRLYHDARFLNLWIQDKVFTLDGVTDLPRYVSKDSYQTVLDDKSGYDLILLDDDSKTSVSSGVVGILNTMHCLLGGKYLPMFIIVGDKWFRIFSAPLEIRVVCI